MKTINIKWHKIINYISIAITVALTDFFLVNLIGNPLHRNNPKLFASWPFFILQPLLVIFAFIINIKSQQQKGVLLFALFLSLISQDFVLQYIRMLNADWIPYLIVVISYALTGTVYIKSFECFPRQITKQEIASVFPKNKIASFYLNWIIKDYTWFVFPVIIGLASLLKVKSAFIDIPILLTALLSLYTNYRQSSPTERNKILWLFWGLITYIFLIILLLLIQNYPNENPRVLRLVFSTLMAFTIALMFFMSLFFSNTFNTGVLIRRTIVNGFLFILIIIIYNSIEHYFLHWLSHTLGISDVILSSILSGIFVLAFSPLHHKLMDLLNRKIKNK